MWENEDYQKRVKNAFLNGVYVGNTKISLISALIKRNCNVTNSE